MNASSPQIASHADHAIAHLVRDAARHIASTTIAGSMARRVGDKVFLSAVWVELEAQCLAPYILDGTFDAFKAWCVHANRVGLLVLSRADLVAAMYHNDVASSEVRAPGGGACWHFVNVPQA